jgi:iron complex outermembrane receptor protein
MSQARYSTVEMHPRWTGPLSPRPGDVVPLDSLTDVHSGMLLGRWTNRSGDGTSLQVQSFLSRRERHDVKIQDTERIADVDLQYRKPLAARHDLVVGGGYRAASFSSVPTFALDLGADDNSVTNAFAQDEISLGRGLVATLGAKLEHDSDAGWGVLPSARMLWGVQKTRVWAAVSQARRTPSSNDRQLRVNLVSFPGPSGLPVLLRVVGNPDYRTENLLSTEAGYRVQLGAAAVDVAVFRGAYRRLLTQEPLAPVFEASPAPPHVVVASRYDNLLDANTAGVEIAGHWTPRALWRLDGSYSAFRVTPHVNPASRDAAAANVDGHTPNHQWQLHSSTWVGSRLQFNGSMYYTGRLRVLQVPDYTRVDAGAEIKLTNQLSTTMLGQNLLQSRHAEFTGAGIGLVPSLVQRSGRVGLRWRF